MHEPPNPTQAGDQPRAGIAGIPAVARRLAPIPLDRRDRLPQAGEVLAEKFKVTDRFSYTLPNGGKVYLSLYGLGSLKGTRVDADGNLFLSFNATGQKSGIVGRVVGGDGRAPLGGIVPYALRNNPNSQTGSGAPGIAFINLHRFDLKQDGLINLLGGVGAFYLGSAGPDTTIYMKQGPISPILNPFTRNGIVQTTSSGLQIIPPTTVGVTLPSGSTFAGEALIPADAVAAQTTTSGTSNSTSFQGIDFQIDRIDATAAPNGGPRLQFAQIYAAAYNPATSSAELLRYQYDPATRTAALAEGSTPIAIGTPGAVTAAPEVGMSRYLDARGTQQLVVLVGVGSTVYAYDALNPTSTPIGSFTTTNLKDALGNPITAPINGVGSSPSGTVIGFSQPPANADLTQTAGTLQRINVTESINTGQAVAIGAPFSPRNGFNQTGGVTGVSASNAVATVGAAHFSSFTPDLFRAGFLGASISGAGLSEAARSQISAPAIGSVITNAQPNYAAFGAFQALGSIEQNLALWTGSTIVNDAGGNPQSVNNQISLYNSAATSAPFFANASFPTALGYTITGLGESFHPELVGASIIDVQGNLRSLRASSIRGGVINVNGQLQTLTVGTLSQSTVVGRPLAHVQVFRRGDNVNLYSTPIRKGTRGGVRIFSVNVLRPFGPLNDPAPRVPQPPIT
ncbi:MAG: hypothetical protein U0800_07855 [Isosphaeraceae bacterium]